MAAGKSDIEAGAAYVRLYTKGYDLVLSQFTSLGKSLTGIGLTLAGIGAGISAPLIAATSHFIEVGGALDDMSHRTGIARNKLAILSYGAKQVGIDIAAVETAIKGMIKKGFDPAEFDRIVKEINAIDDSFRRAQASVYYFGKAGYEILQLIEEWDSIQKRARELGIGLSDEDIRLADQLGDAVADLQGLFSQITTKIGAALAPVLLPILDAVTTIASTVSKWVDENREIVPIIAGIAAGLVVVGVALYGIGQVMLFIVGLAASISTIVAGWTVFAALAAPVAAIATGIGAVVIGLIAVGLALSLALFLWLRFTESGQQFWSHMITGIQIYLTRWRGFVEETKVGFKGISDAIKAGEIELSWNIMLLGMRSSFLEFVAEIAREVRDLSKQFDALIASIDPLESLLPGNPLRLDKGILGDNSAENLFVKAAEAQAKQARDELRALTGEAASKAAAVQDGQAASSADLSSLLTGFNAQALLRAGSLASFDPSAAREEKQIGLLETIAGHLGDIRNKVGKPETATA
jgi:hypothetical protein